ncbi:hypothetical protein GS511_05465 [Leptospira borgpetersenii]|uniref:Uncharacterized protein n=2 Tax=Leptospira borgpetersenii TaxID=174 RepID=A0A0S2IPK0_LEPBO|nr:hypothetical protein LBBP_01292 [Leptospira borgpetersenii serovar Ballum]APY24855.1 Uncharacterized protein LB4E_1045 [Leptospira borgpetersenii str. 4E]EKP14076.1 hypothetical protein LEP1GSC128_0440 [Leptospira borgpetersenii str. 200801926]EKQ98553.1 hypothetical protein LEP1GSC121_2991 [Leptospira borgpetersenii serovar Castellonis str. 200801910]EMK13687.1 hypothetical protein LEP1GSC066_4199 [Leptospira sp. serovar Kenya str. Sh9]EMO11322.1 hypothetical protein LEP1GSC137_1353 [Lepto
MILYRADNKQKNITLENILTEGLFSKLIYSGDLSYVCKAGLLNAILSYVSPTEKQKFIYDATKNPSQNLEKNIFKRSCKFLKNVGVPTETVTLAVFSRPLKL